MRDLLLKGLTKSTQEILKNHNLSLSNFPFKINLEQTKAKEHGDFTSNIALLLSKILNSPPVIIANKIVEQLKFQSDMIENIVVAPPGFINFNMSNQYWINVLKKILVLKNSYGHSNEGQGEKIIIEFVSANPTGPLHIGHGRCAALGDSLSNLMTMAGYNVFKEYYVNDTGRQIDLLGESVYSRYKEIVGINSKFPETGYKGAYIKKIAQELYESDGKKYMDLSSDVVISIISKFASEKILEKIRNDLYFFGVVFNSWFSEDSLFKEKKISKIISYLKEKNFIYVKDGALWMKTSIFGDQKDRVVVRSNGEPTYFASDIAYHQNKFERGFKKIINIWGADHHGYINRINSVLKALNYSENSFSILLVQMVRLIQNQIQIDMSTRKGSFISLEELIKEVGKDAARFFFLLRSHDSQLEFDIELAKKESAENPVYYCQYAHARICSIEKLAKNKGLYKLKPDDICLKMLKLEEEKEILKKLEGYPYVIKSAVHSLEPHRITFYLIELSTLFHKYYNAYRIISDDLLLTNARMNLIKAIRFVLKSGLSVLGVSSPEKM